MKYTIARDKPLTDEHKDLFEALWQDLYVLYLHSRAMTDDGIPFRHRIEDFIDDYLTLQEVKKMGLWDLDYIAGQTTEKVKTEKLIETLLKVKNGITKAMNAERQIEAIAHLLSSEKLAEQTLKEWEEGK